MEPYFRKYKEAPSLWLSRFFITLRFCCSLWRCNILAVVGTDIIPTNLDKIQQPAILQYMYNTTTIVKAERVLWRRNKIASVSKQPVTRQQQERYTAEEPNQNNFAIPSLNISIFFSVLCKINIHKTYFSGIKKY